VSPEIEEERRLLDVAFILLFRSASSPWPETRRAIGTYVGQMGFAKKDHQVCLAHLIRDVQYAIDAPDLRHLPVRACRIGQRRERLANATLKTYATWLDARLDELMARQPTHEAGVKLQPMIKRTRRYLFAFATNPICRQPIMAPSAPCALVLYSAKSPLGFGPNGARSSARG
jgi:hypothetical protein